MSTDHYTQIHNLALRGGIPTRYVGIFGYIASHTEGWELTEATVCSVLGVGRDFVRSALHALEAAQCLVRTRRRSADGTLREGVWFVTDLPLQLRQLGITDEAVIRDKVQTAYEEWRAEKPRTENPPLVTTSENASIPRSGPKSGFPTLADPTLANPTHKKTLSKKTFQEETSCPPPTSPHTPISTTGGGGQEEPSAETTDQETLAQAADLIDSLPAIRRSRIGRATQRPQLIEAAVQRLQQGWSAADLRAELSRDLGTADGTGIYHYRLASLPDIPPAVPPIPTEPSSKPTHPASLPIETRLIPRPVDGEDVAPVPLSAIPVGPRTTAPAALRCIHGRLPGACREPECRPTTSTQTSERSESHAEPLEARAEASAMDPRLSQLLSAVASTSARR